MEEKFSRQRNEKRLMHIKEVEFSGPITSKK